MARGQTLSEVRLNRSCDTILVWVLSAVVPSGRGKADSGA